MAQYKIVISMAVVEVEADSPGHAYSKVHKAMTELAPSGWESSDVWYEDGEPLSEKAIHTARTSHFPIDGR